MWPNKNAASFTQLMVLSLILIGSGFVLLCIWPAIFALILDHTLVLSPHSSVYNTWKQNPFPVSIDFYFFNWTNAEDVHNLTIKPHFQQVGPYRFWETKQKSNVTWNRNGTVSFRQLRRWHADPAVGNLSDLVTTINPIAVSAAYTARHWNYFTKKGFALSLASMAPTVYNTKRVSEMLFDGYSDPLITVGRSLPFLKDIPPWDKFGWFYTRNESSEYDGTFNMGTGYNGTTFGRLYHWKYRYKTDYYKSPCNLIQGSAGELFPPNPQSDNIALFAPDICRSVKLDYDGDSIVNNIVGRKYVAGKTFLDNGTSVSENTCFCADECMPSGVLNVSTCRYGTPAFVSLPHFYGADPYYTDSIEGLQGTKQNHEFFITLEPTTGIPLEVAARLQINLLLQPISGVWLYEHVPRIFIPVLWFEQVVKIPDNFTFELKLLLNFQIICTAIGIIVLFCGAVLVTITLYRAYLIPHGRDKCASRNSYRMGNITLRGKNTNDNDR